MPDLSENIERLIIDKAKELGATLAGIADADELRVSPSYKAHGECNLGEEVRSVVALILEHPPAKPGISISSSLGNIPNRFPILRTWLKRILGEKRKHPWQVIPCKSPPGVFPVPHTGTMRWTGTAGSPNRTTPGCMWRPPALYLNVIIIQLKILFLVSIRTDW